MKYLFFIFFILLAISSATAATVSIGDYQTPVGSEVTVPVSINGSGSVAGGVVNISFDPSIVSVKDVVFGDFGNPVANINNSYGWLKFVAARSNNVNNNDSVLANIVFNGSLTGVTGVNLTYAILNNESGHLFTPAIKNGSIEVVLSLDDTPPSSITDLRSTAGDTWINWTWTNPEDADFNHTMIYFDGASVADFTETHFKATGLQPATIHTISTHTADINGNINQTWVNNTAVTHGNLPGGLKINILKPQNYSIIPAGEKLTIQINVTDLAGNPVTFDILSFAYLSGPNGASRNVILSEDAGNYTGEYLVSRDDPSGMWTANITAYNSTASGKASVRLLFTGAYIIQPYTRSHSYLIGEIANFTARVVKPGSSPQILSDQNLSLNISVYPFNTSTPVIESIEMEFNDTSNLFYGSIDTGSIGPGLFNIVFNGNDTSGNFVTAGLLIGVSEDFTIEVDTEKAFYDRNEAVNISGIVKYLNNSPLENIGVNLKIDIHGFKRSYSVTTNETGHFNYTFHPFDTEAGKYSIRAEAYNLGLPRYAERNFTIHGLYLVPQSAKIEMVEDSIRNINFTLYNLGDTTITGIRATVNDMDISDKVTATIDTVPSELQSYQSASIRIQIKAETPVPDTAKFNIEITSDQNSNEISELNVKLFKPDPVLKVYPAEVIIGLNRNQTKIETVAIYNMGYGMLRNVTLHQPENNWMSITSNTSIGDLLPGENATFDIHINSYNVDTGIYEDSVNISSNNYHEVQVNVTAFVTELTNGSLLFHVTDALERNLSNANISLINQDTYDEFASSTNSTGYALMTDLPVGRYIFEVSSDGINTLPQMGTVEVEPMDTPKLIEISLYMSFIDFDWEVIPTSIEDYYNVILKMRFETDVPIPLLLAFPPGIDYNMVPGEEKTDSFTLYNVGLVSIYNVSISQINHNGVVLEPLITTIDEIKGKSNVKVPYKIKLSSSASSCKEISGKINIQGRYIHFINNHEVISYAGTSIPVAVKTPIDETCKLDLPEWPDLAFCVNIDGLHLGDYTENLDVDPNIIWLKTGPGWEDQKDETSPVLENVATAKNNNEIGNIKLSKALGITLSIGVNELVSYFTVGTLEPQIPLGVDVVDVVAKQYGINIPYFDGLWNGTFDPELISPGQTSSLNMQKLDTGVGVTLPKILGGGIVFNFGNEECYNCIWIIPIAGYDLTLPVFELPHIDLYYPHVHLPSGGGGSVGGGTFCWNCVPDIFIVPTLPHFSGITYVPWDWPEWNWQPAGSDPIRPKPKPKMTQTIHEVVELSISQNVTMERDAFWAGLGIRNRMPDKNINNIRVDLHIKGNSGSANDKFFIQAPRLKGISSIDGSGLISPLALAKAQWLIIPKPGAGGVDPEGTKYNISANISYSVDGVNFEISTQEIEILVKPQPEMVLDYFIPSDVIANKPFKLAVKVTNEGYGEARNFAIETAQPVIYYNPSGLLLDFEIINSQLQGEDRSTSLKVDFGDIKPGESKIAWWDMVTSIDGTFTKFTGEYTHSSELGGLETSLIKKINTYIIQKQMVSGELGYDFLANSQDDETDYMLFNSSTGSSTFVSNASYSVVDMPEPDNPFLNLSIEDYSGDWVIISIEDPYNNAVPIEKVIRTRDGTEIPSYNYWMRNGRILIVDHYEVGFDGNYSIIFKYSNLVPVFTTNRTMFDGSTVAEENTAINFNGTDSYDEFGSIVSYRWEFGDGTEAVGEKVDHIFSKMGEYQINLTITNNAGVSNKDSLKVKIVKQIVDVLLIPSDFTTNKWNLQSEKMDEIERYITNYYFETSYGSIFINFKNYPQIITLNRLNYQGSERIVQDVIGQTISGSNIDQDFVIVVTTEVIGALGIAYRPSDLDLSYPTAIIPTSINSGELSRVWVHEIGHVLGRIIRNSHRNPMITQPDQDMLWDLYNGGIIKISGNAYLNDGGISSDWELMSGLSAGYPPHPSSMSKVLLGWMNPKLVLRGETVELKPIEQGFYGSNAFVHIVSDNIQYVIEAREKPNKNIVLYKLTEYDLINDKVNSAPNHKFKDSGGIEHPAVTINSFDNKNIHIFNNGKFLDLVNFVVFEVSIESETPFNTKVKIRQPNWIEDNIDGNINEAYNYLEGVAINTITSLGKTKPPWSDENSNYYEISDIDLHAYSEDGKHVGVNYSTGIYEVEIPGALTSYDSNNDVEWIFVPSNVKTTYYVSSYDVQKFLEVNPEFNTLNANINYSATFIRYGIYPEFKELPDGNWTIQNRTVSNIQSDFIVPGEFKKLILEDFEIPSTITNLTSINGPTWLNFTWTNPPDPDFNHIELYLNGAFLTNVTSPQNYFNITGLIPDTEYELGTHTVDSSGNVNETWVNKTAWTASTAPASIQVTNPIANPSIILHDNGRQRPVGTNLTTLNVTVTGDVASVTIDLSPIGGSVVAPMARLSDTDIYTITTNATSGINRTNDLIVNATDTSGNFNNSVIIQLTVLLRGDIVRDNKIDLKDLLYMRRHLAGLEPSINMLVADIQPADGDGNVDLKDLLFLRRYLAGLETSI